MTKSKPKSLSRVPKPGVYANCSGCNSQRIQPCPAE
jgi:hypothetical protein